ncbi:MAG: GNAT family N-acetyltransferase [Polaromonas sp.]|nr:GNAT family N-acetyltransferase [Polaromonas sp.]
MPRLLPDILTTTRLRLRAPSLADTPALFQAYTQNPAVCRFMIWSPHRSEDDTRAFMTWCVGAWDEGKKQPYVITDAATGEAIGMIEARLQGTTVDIGYVLSQAHWGRGLMPEAIEAVTGAALAAPGIFRVHATCDTENIASQRVLEKSGFLREGRLERYTVHPNISPEPRACFMYARCR